MNQIKFSHKYPKLWNQKSAHLIQIRIIEKGCVNDELKEYDTKFYHDQFYDHHGNLRDWKESYYELPNTKLLQLIFIGDKDIPFCTLRRWTPNKEKYYQSKVGEEFKINMGES